MASVRCSRHKSGMTGHLDDLLTLAGALSTEDALAPLERLLSKTPVVLLASCEFRCFLFSTRLYVYSPREVAQEKHVFQ